MKTLKNIIVNISEDTKQAGVQDEEFELVDILTDISPITDIINLRLESSEQLDNYIVQITADQHLSEERILYIFNSNEQRFLNVSNLTVLERQTYNNIKSQIYTEINK